MLPGTAPRSRGLVGRGVVAEQQHHDGDGRCEPQDDASHRFTIQSSRCGAGRRGTPAARASRSKPSVQALGPQTKTSRSAMSGTQCRSAVSSACRCAAGPRTEVGVRRGPGRRSTCRPFSAASTLELAGEQRLGGVALQQDRLARGVVQPLGQRPQRGDADAGADQHHLAPGAGPAAEPPVRALDQHPGARPQVAPAGAAVAERLDGDPQAAAVGRGGQRVRVGAGPARPAEEPQVEELPGP